MFFNFAAFFILRKKLRGVLIFAVFLCLWDTLQSKNTQKIGITKKSKKD